MTQRDVVRASSIRRKKLISAGAVVGCCLVGLSGLVVRESMRSDDFFDKLLLAIVDKFVLGVVVVLVGYFFQQRLEVFKRDQGLATELAKARIASYNRVIAALYSFDYAGFKTFEAAVGVADELDKNKKAIKLKKLSMEEAEVTRENEALVSIMRTDRFLLGTVFCYAVSRLIEQTKEDIKSAKSSTPPNPSEKKEMFKRRHQMLESISSYLPPFARPPADDAHFKLPDVEPAAQSLEQFLMREKDGDVD